METPSQEVSNFDHLVTQWMSFVISSEGSALNSSQLQRLGSSTSPSMEKSHSERGVRGVGPAERTGNPEVSYCPGGRRPAVSSPPSSCCCGGRKSPWRRILLT